MKRWFAVHCRPQQDARAEANLRNQGYETFRPLARLRRRRRGRLTPVVESLFPRYLFVRLDDTAENWAPIRSTRGVRDLVRLADHRPAAVPEPVIADLTDRADPESGVVDLSLDIDYRPNQPVRITEGPFAGQEALFVARRGEDRVIVLLEILQRAQRLLLPEAALEAS